MPEDHRSRIVPPDDPTGVRAVTIPPRRPLTDAERLAALEQHLALGRDARLHFFPGGASFEHEGAIVRVRDEEIVRTILVRPMPWEDEEGSDLAVVDLAVVDLAVVDLAVVELAVAERTKPYDQNSGGEDVREDGANDDGRDDLAGNAPLLR